MELHTAFHDEIDFAWRVSFAVNAFGLGGFEWLEQWDDGDYESGVLVLEEADRFQSSVVHRHCHFAPDLQRKFFEYFLLMCN